MGASFSTFVNVLQVISVAVQLVQVVPDLRRIAKFYREACEGMHRLTRTPGKSQVARPGSLALTRHRAGVQDNALALEEGRYWYTGGDLETGISLSHARTDENRAVQSARYRPQQPSGAHLRYRPDTLQRRFSSTRLNRHGLPRAGASSPQQSDKFLVILGCHPVERH